jgi:hypothetical protein
VENLNVGGEEVLNGALRCIKNFSGREYPGYTYGRGAWNKCWEPLPGGPETDPGETYVSRDDFTLNVFYGSDDALTIASFGADGKPGGISLNRDIVLTIYRTDWTGEVAGHADYSDHFYADTVTIRYPQYDPQSNADNFIREKEIFIVDNDSGHGIHFRFGTAPEVGDRCRPDCDYNGYANFAYVSIPMGIRSISVGGRIHVFTVEPTGNWVGTVNGESGRVSGWAGEQVGK